MIFIAPVKLQVLYETIKVMCRINKYIRGEYTQGIARNVGEAGVAEAVVNVNGFFGAAGFGNGTNILHGGRIRVFHAVRFHNDILLFCKLCCSAVSLSDSEILSS